MGQWVSDLLAALVTNGRTDIRNCCSSVNFIYMVAVTEKPLKILVHAKWKVETLWTQRTVSCSEKLSARHEIESEFARRDCEFGACGGVERAWTPVPGSPCVVGTGNILVGAARARNKWAVESRRRLRPGTADAGGIQDQRSAPARRLDRPSSTSVIGHNAPPSVAPAGARVHRRPVTCSQLPIWRWHCYFSSSFRNENSCRA